MLHERRSVWVPTFTMTVCMCVALVAFFYLPAFAQGRECADDMARLCPDLKGKRGPMMQCLREHRAELTPQCQARVQALETKIGEVSNACRDDVQQFCSAVKGGQGRILQCLRKHESELSSACQTELAQARSMRRSNR